MLELLADGFLGFDLCCLGESLMGVITKPRFKNSLKNSYLKIVPTSLLSALVRLGLEQLSETLPSLVVICYLFACSIWFRKNRQA